MLIKLQQFYFRAKRNIWYRYFTVLCRVLLALGFIPSGYIKLIGERFTALPSNHPLGQYFDSLHQTGFYYTFLGISQLLIALLLLIPRTALLGALLYFPIILNICILAYATRFEGTRITTFMLLANIYLLCWDYDRIRSILPFQRPAAINKAEFSRKFPFAFFGTVILILASVVVINIYLYNIRPGNSNIECTNGCKGSEFPQACETFCDCIYNKGKPLEKCLEEYERVKKIESVKQESSRR